MALTIKQLLDLLGQLTKFKIVTSNNKTLKATFDTTKIQYLNLIHRLDVHIIGDNELQYLNSLRSAQQSELIKELITNQAKVVIFDKSQTIPATFLKQSSIIIVSTGEKVTPQQLLTKFDISKNETGKPGAFVVVYNQGIFITGSSGIGKSELLLSLVDRGHSWVADDLVVFHKNNNQEIIANANQTLSNIVHIKNIGPLNMDALYGETSRKQQYKLAASIHLSDNINDLELESSVLVPQVKRNILGQEFPCWYIDGHSNKLTLLVETCAKILSLNYPNYSTINEIHTNKYA